MHEVTSKHYDKLMFFDSSPALIKDKVHIRLTNAFFFDRLAPSNDKEE